MTLGRRPLALLCLLLVLALAVVVAGCGGDDGEGGAGGSQDPKALLERAFAHKVGSGELRLDLRAEVEGVEQLKGPLALSVAGPFKSNGRLRLPSLDLDIAVRGAGQRLSGGLVTTKDNAFVELEGQAYELGEDIARRYTSSQRRNPGRSLESLGVQPDSWLKDPEVKEGADIGGDSTRLVTGSVDIERVIHDFFDLLRSPTFRRQLERQGQTAPRIPEPDDKDLEKVKDAVEELRFEANVDENDVLRRVFVKARLEAPEDADAGDVKGADLSFGYTLEKVGGEPEIHVPSRARPFSELLRQFGLGGALGGGAPRRQ